MATIYFVFFISFLRAVLVGESFSKGVARGGSLLLAV